MPHVRRRVTLFAGTARGYAARVGMGRSKSRKKGSSGKVQESMERCRVCKVPVKRTNLKRHLRKIHDQT